MRQLKVNTCATVMRCNRPCRIRRAAHPQNPKLTTEPETPLLDLQEQRKQRFFEALTWFEKSTRLIVVVKNERQGLCRKQRC